MGVTGEHVLIAANPKSGAVSSQQRVAELCAAVQSRGFQCSVLNDLQAVQKQGMLLHQSGLLKAVVAAGGDGTADALANLFPADLPLLVFPLGTENLLAKYLNITGDIRQACDILSSGHKRHLDVGNANGKLFLVMLSCGFDAEVVRQMHAIRTGHINRWSYSRPIWNSLRCYRFPQLHIRLGAETDRTANEVNSPADSNAVQEAEAIGLPMHLSAAWLFVFNVPRYAASLNFCPQADASDGLLDVCLFQRSGILPGLGYLSRLWLGTHQGMRDFRHIRCRQLGIELAPELADTAKMNIPYQVDGDPGGVLPLQIEVLPDRLTLLVPTS